MWASLHIYNIFLAKVITSFFQCAQINVVKYINVAHTGKYCPHSSLLNHFNVIWEVNWQVSVPHRASILYNWSHDTYVYRDQVSLINTCSFELIKHINYLSSFLHNIVHMPLPCQIVGQCNTQKLNMVYSFNNFTFYQYIRHLVT